MTTGAAGESPKAEGWEPTGKGGGHGTGTAGKHTEAEMKKTQIQQLSDGQEVNRGKTETESCGHGQREQVSVSRTPQHHPLGVTDSRGTR